MTFPTNDLEQNHRELTGWVKSAFAFWAESGRDSQGGWYECLERDETPSIEAIRRHRVQARQVYCYSIAAKKGWYSSASNVLETTFDFMVKYGWIDGHFIHRMDGQYNVIDGRFDLYDHAFYLLSAASAYAATGKDIYLEWIDKIEKIIDDAAIDHGGWAEDSNGSLPRRQNPHMHLFEVFLFLYEHTKNPKYLSKAESVLELFHKYFYDDKAIGIREFFTEDWKLDAEQGDVFEPGHAAEWIWLLGWYDRLSGGDHSAIRKVIFDRLLSQSTPYLCDETMAPNHEVVRSTRRLWVQTEWIKAHLVLIQDGHHSALENVASVLEAFKKDYLMPSGGWNDQFDSNGTDIASTIPASSFYHIVSMVFEIDKFYS